MTSFLKHFKEKVYKLIWFLILPFIKLRYTIKGYFKCKNVLEEGSVYYVSDVNLYYKYLGNNLFKEGNKTIDTGFLAIEIPGNLKKMSYMKIGIFNFMFIRKDFNIFEKNKYLCLQKK